MARFENIFAQVKYILSMKSIWHKWYATSQKWNVTHVKCESRITRFHQEWLIFYIVRRGKGLWELGSNVFIFTQINLLDISTLGLCPTFNIYIVGHSRWRNQATQYLHRSNRNWTGGCHGTSSTISAKKKTVPPLKLISLMYI